MSILEIIGTALGVFGVGLMIRQNLWAWPVGLVQVTVSAWVFYGAKLYSDAILQVFFFVIQTYGWWHWVKGGRTRQGRLPVTRMRVRAVIGWSVAGAVCTVVWGETMRRTTDAALPHWDAFILVFSLLAQWWQARKRLECWAGWMVVNVVAVAVYWAKDLHLYAGLYGIFFAMAVAGHMAWQKSLTAQPAADGLPEAADSNSRTPSVR
jgi:nicotinamide mononucleotide transporter